VGKTLRRRTDAQSHSVLPFLLDNSYPKKLVNSVELISSEEHHATLRCRIQSLFIRERCSTACCSIGRGMRDARVQRSRVMSVDTTAAKPRYCVEGDWQEADFLVLAAGARNQLVPESRALQRDELEMTQGYFVPQTSDSITIKFLRNFEGYIWSFPRCDHLSVGICGQYVVAHERGTRGHLQRSWISTAFNRGPQSFIVTCCFTEGAHAFRKERHRQELGARRHAAAWVDPLTGEDSSMRFAPANCSGARSPKAARRSTGLGEGYFLRELEFAARIVRRSIADLSWEAR